MYPSVKHGKIDPDYGLEIAIKKMEPRFADSIVDANRRIVTQKLQALLNLPIDRQESVIRAGALLANREQLLELLGTDVELVTLLEAIRTKLLGYLERHPVPGNIPEVKKKIAQRIHAYDLADLMRIGILAVIDGEQAAQQHITTLIQHEINQYN